MRRTDQQAEDMVRRTLSPKRFQHTMNVKKLAVRMAQHYGVDTEKAALAAVLHDSAKELPRTELLQIMQDNAIIKKGTQNRPEPVWQNPMECAGRRNSCGHCLPYHRQGKHEQAGQNFVFGRYDQC